VGAVGIPALLVPTQVRGKVVPKSKGKKGGKGRKVGEGGRAAAAVPPPASSSKLSPPSKLRESAPLFRPRGAVQRGEDTARGNS
jgi:hypothetical protein